MSDFSALSPGTWTVDPSHSHIGFVVRHLMVAKVRGTFNEFTGTITVPENPLEASLVAEVQMASIDTKDAGRDGHLKTGDFFEVETYPTMTLRSTSIEANGGDLVLHGDLTIKGITHPVAFDLEFDGVAQDPYGNTKAGFSATGEINRKDFGIEWNMVLETGGIALGEKVKIEIEIEAVKG
jgi:polyisoprenoid-binding protein YceI